MARIRFRIGSLYVMVIVQCALLVYGAYTTRRSTEVFGDVRDAIGKQAKLIMEQRTVIAQQQVVILQQSKAIGDAQDILTLCAQAR